MTSPLKLLSLLAMLALSSAAGPLDARISALAQKVEKRTRSDASDEAVHKFTSGAFASCKEVHAAKQCENTLAKMYCKMSCPDDSVAAGVGANKVHAAKCTVCDTCNYCEACCYE